MSEELYFPMYERHYCNGETGEVTESAHKAQSWWKNGDKVYSAIYVRSAVSVYSPYREDNIAE